jgi:hypothetical protein
MVTDGAKKLQEELLAPEHVCARRQAEPGAVLCNELCCAAIGYDLKKNQTSNLPASPNLMTMKINKGASTSARIRRGKTKGSLVRANRNTPQQ